MHFPKKLQWLALTHILKKLNFTKYYGILYQRGTPSQLQGFTHANYLICKNIRQSIDAYLFQLDSGSVAWASKQQPNVSDGQTKAEYKALSKTVK